MASFQEAELGQLIWNGEYEEAFDVAEARFKAEPLTGLVPFAVTLYSWWQREKGDKLLRTRIERDYAHLIHPLTERVSLAFDSADADTLDVISTHMTWWGYVVEGYDTVKARIVAHEAVDLGLELTENEPREKHTRTLLILTKAALLFHTHNKGPAIRFLGDAAARAPFITDVNQRSRVYRKLAFYYGRCLRPFKAFQFFAAARSVPGIAPDVRAKNRLFA
ncbi:MAG: hypothetical protein AB202_03780 [Parcubacteria bacterium C7867-007]|nr:MAG: hypothetical protein AB202_03780 [Parcubacteria bacterium C7867-007]